MSKVVNEQLVSIIQDLASQNIIAYPTEAVFGLGCDPDSEAAVMQLLILKQRPVEKGLILIAADYQQLTPYIDDSHLSPEQKKKMFASWPGPVTWVIPARPSTPNWLTRRFSSLAVRVTAHPLVRELCHGFGKPIVSTSANLSGLAPCRTVKNVLSQFGAAFPVLLGETSGWQNPSEIRDVLTGSLIRQG
ncbi:MAG: L-threonylcarbamoyladenylate synthase type 1 TsaC [Candidatus Malihini olakiniferum]